MTPRGGTRRARAGGPGRLASALAVAAFVGWASPGALHAQSLDRLLDGASGTVSFHFEVADSVEICENSIRRGSGSRTTWSWNGDDGACTTGEAGILATVRGGEVVELEIAPPSVLEADREFGRVAPDAAARWLVEVPWNTSEDDPAGLAWMALGLIPEVDVSERMAVGVRDRGLDPEVREQLLFWAGQMVSDRLLGRALADVARGEGEEQELRDHAIFALSQRPAEESVPLLMELATGAPHLESRRSALFWLAQNDTEEVGDFFAELILDRGGI